MEILKPGKIAVDAAIKTLSLGGLVIYPTETVYGIGADATNSNAIKKLTEYKKRPLGKPYSIAVSDIFMAAKYVDINKTAENLYKEFLPGPLTIVSKGKHILAPGVESEIGTLGIRIPDYKLVTDIVNKLGKPITATSANASYKRRPYKIPDILENISLKQIRLIDLIIDAGELPAHEPSTVIDTTLDDLVVLRQGDIKIKNSIELTSRSEESTQNTGKELWQKYEKYSGQRPIIFALEGPMGAGKTQFTKGLARSMGIREDVVSPTFSLLLDYKTDDLKTVLFHFDAWKLENPEEILSLDFNEILRNKNSVVVIEWAEKIINILREHSEDTVIVWVKLAYGESENERIISWGTL